MAWVTELSTAALIGPSRLILPAVPARPLFAPSPPELEIMNAGVERFTESSTIPPVAWMAIWPPLPPLDRTPVAPLPVPPSVERFPRMETPVPVTEMAPPVPPIAGTVAVASGLEPLVLTCPRRIAVP